MKGVEKENGDNSKELRGHVQFGQLMRTDKKRQSVKNNKRRHVQGECTKSVKKKKGGWTSSAKACSLETH